MADHASPWNPLLYAEKGYCPAADYIKSETDARVRARIIAKIRHLAAVGAAEARRPLVDTLEGLVKELVVDKQVRIIFSWEHDRRVLLILGGTRKKNGKVDPKVVERAVQDREKWLEKNSHAKLESLEKQLGVR